MATGLGEQGVLVCTEKLLASNRDSSQAFQEALYDFPGDLSKGTKEGKTSLALPVFREVGEINTGEFELHPFHSGEQAFLLACLFGDLFTSLHFHCIRSWASFTWEC